jgi:hypothetical protein
MTIAEDTTNSPALVVSSGPTTDTAAFTPPNAGCILVCFMFGDANNGSADESLTASDTLGGTWSTPILDNARGGAAVAISWRAVAAGTAASMVVKVTDNKGSVAKGNFTRIFTGTDLTAPFGATGTAGTSNISLVSTVTNSWCWSALLTSNVLQVAGSNTTQKTEFGGFDSGDAIGVYASTNTTATAGTTITLAESGGTPVHNVAIELLPPGGATTVNATVAFAAGAQLAAAGVVTELGAVAFSAGATMTDAAVVTKLATASFAASATMADTATQTGFPAVAMAAGAVLADAGVVTKLGAVTMAAGATFLPAAFDTVLPGAGFAAGAVLAAAGSRTAVVAAGFGAGAQLTIGATSTLASVMAMAAGASFSITAASLGPLVASVLIPGGSSGSTLVPGGAATATLVSSGALVGALTPGGAAASALISSGAPGSTLSAGGV